MTDRVRILTVYLDDDYLEDEVEAVVKAIMMIKCVGGVEKGAVGSVNQAARHDRWPTNTPGRTRSGNE